jgi:tripartite-type tricarboxylate transporter receptor subunit TctC
MSRIASLIVALALAVTAAPAFAWPDKPLRFYVGFSAGGSADRVARLFAETVKQQFGDLQIIIDNQPGDSGAHAIAAMLAANDNHTFLLHNDELLTVPLVKRDAGYDTLRDLKPVAMLAEGSYVAAVGTKAPFGTFDAFAQHARANPGKVTYVTVGKWTKLHLIGEYISRQLKLGMVHVDTRGSGVSVNDLIDGKIHMAFVGMPPLIRSLRSGELTALAVTTPTRDPRLPQTPTLKEVGLPDFASHQRFGLLAPRSMPDALIDRLSVAAATALADARLRAELEELGLVARPSTPDEYRAILANVTERWRKMIVEHGLSVD